MLHGNTCVKYSGTFFGGGKAEWYERDSSGYIVGADGRIHYSYLETDMTLHSDMHAFYDIIQKMGPQTSITTGLGTFGVLDLQNIITRAAGSTIPAPEGVNACGNGSYGSERCARTAPFTAIFPSAAKFCGPISSIITSRLK